MRVNVRRRLKNAAFGMRSLRRPSVAYCVSNNLLPSVFVRTPAAILRAALLLPESKHETQLNQDVFALVANRFRPGYFVEIGANDGFELSNTLYLEEAFGWTGLLIEANPKYSASLRRRSAKSVVAAVVAEEGYYEFSDAGLFGGVRSMLRDAHVGQRRHAQPIEVWGTTLGKLLETHDAPSTINFISIDVEGAEVPIVEQLCESKDYRFSAGCIEHNSRSDDYRRISMLLEGASYRVVWEGQTEHDLFFIDVGHNAK